MQPTVVVGDWGWIGLCTHGVTTPQVMLGVSLRARRDTTQVMLGVSLQARLDTTLVYLTQHDHKLLCRLYASRWITYETCGA